jgi:TetR/AcrR family transcriptional repressor of uid operon
MEASRRLFGSRGFHSTPMAELATAANISVGQIYRFFPGKDDIIVAIVEEDARDHLEELERISNAAEVGEMSELEAIQRFACNALTRANEALSFEILAESYRNPRVAATLQVLTDRYRALVRRLILRVRPELQEVDLEACEEILTACFFGLGLKTSSRPMMDAPKISRATACLIIRGLSSSGECA